MLCFSLLICLLYKLENVKLLYQTYKWKKKKKKQNCALKVSAPKVHLGSGHDLTLLTKYNVDFVQMLH